MCRHGFRLATPDREPHPLSHPSDPPMSPAEPLLAEVQRLALLEVVSRLRAHDNKTVSQQASLTEQRLTAQS